MKSRIARILLVGIFIVGCASEHSPDVTDEPTEVPTEKLTQEPTKEATAVATDAATILAGAWILASEPNPGSANLIHFTEDGEWRWGYGLSMLEARLAGETTGIVEFNGMQMTHIWDLTCQEIAGSYEVVVLDSGNVIFKPLVEECVAREVWFNPEDDSEWTRFDVPE